MSEVARIIDSLGGYAKVAEELRQPSGTVAAWRHRGSIPVKHWPGIARLADARASGSVSYAALVAAHAAAPAVAPAPDLASAR